MNASFTEDDIVRFIYNEVSTEEERAIRRAIETDSDTSQAYLSLLNVMHQLDTFSLGPSKSTVDIIIEHSHHSSLETSL